MKTQKRIIHYVTGWWENVLAVYHFWDFTLPTLLILAILSIVMNTRIYFKISKIFRSISKQYSNEFFRLRSFTNQIIGSGSVVADNALRWSQTGKSADDLKRADSAMASVTKQGQYEHAITDPTIKDASISGRLKQDGSISGNFKRTTATGLQDKERRVMEIRKQNQMYDMKMRLDGHGVMRTS